MSIRSRIIRNTPGDLRLDNLTAELSFPHSYSYTGDKVQKLHLDFYASTNFDIDTFVNQDWNQSFPGNVLVHCQWCGNWAARQTSCKSCGGRVD